MKMRFFTEIVVVLCLFLSACSGGSGSDNTQNNDVVNDSGNSTDGDSTGGVDSGTVSGVQQVGSVRVSRSGSATFDFVSLSANFKSFNPALSDFTLPSVANPQQDTCEISGDGSLPRSTTAVFDLDIVFYFYSTSEIRDQISDRYTNSQGISISAGETLVFASPAGTFGQLDHQLSGAVHGYQMPSGSIVGAAPESLILDITGDEFPAFTDIDIRVPAQVPYQDAQSSFGGSDSGFQLSWQADSDNESFIVIRGQGNNFDVTPIRIVDFICLLQDDGTFELSAADQQTIVDALAGEPGESVQFSSLEFQRVIYQTQRVDDVLLIIESIVAGEKDT